MEYKLAKELFDVGFTSPTSFMNENGWEAPTLSELIEACGEEFASLERKSFGWMAFGFRKYEEFDITAPTPEEAVARLWLALNPKKQPPEGSV